MRAFVAVQLPEEIQKELARRQAAFRGICRDARWTRPQGIHLTLKFLAEISDAQAREITSRLAAVATFEKFSVEIKGFGFFPDVRRPRVFWAGVTASTELGELARLVEDTLEKLGFAREQRAFSPHLTLARFREPRPQPELAQAAARLAETSLGHFEVSEFFLYESRLTPQGAEYHKVARIPAE